VIPVVHIARRGSNRYHHLRGGGRGHRIAGTQGAPGIVNTFARIMSQPTQRAWSKWQLMESIDKFCVHV
jgi:hypothetical protein